MTPVKLYRHLIIKRKVTNSFARHFRALNRWALRNHGLSITSYGIKEKVAPATE